jgi:pimeloyl-ACP methyl ester carboxylesterase
MHFPVHNSPVYAYTGARPRQRAQASLVFVHGSANDHAVWALQSRYFAHHGWNVFALDLPGHGKSEGKALAGVPQIADWLDQVLEALGVERAAMVGHSLGALAVLDFAARYPGRAERIALLGPAAPMTVNDTLLDAARADDHVAYELINGWSYSPQKQLGGNRQPGVWMTGNAMRLMERTQPGVLWNDLAACHGYADGLRSAAKVTCPALLVLGQRDIMAPVRNGLAMAREFSDARVVTLPGCGHSTMSEDPDGVLDALRSFLGPK